MSDNIVVVILLKEMQEWSCPGRLAKGWFMGRLWERGV